MCSSAADATAAVMVPMFAATEEMAGVSASSPLTMRERTAPSASPQNDVEIESWRASKEGPRSSSTVEASDMAAAKMPIPAAAAPRMPGIASSAGRVWARLTPNWATVPRPAPAMEVRPRMAVPAPAALTAKVSRFVNRSLSEFFRLPKTLPPARALT